MSPLMARRKKDDSIPLGRNVYTQKKRATTTTGSKKMAKKEKKYRAGCEMAEQKKNRNRYTIAFLQSRFRFGKPTK